MHGILTCECIRESHEEKQHLTTGRGTQAMQMDLGLVGRLIDVVPGFLAHRTTQSDRWNLVVRLHAQHMLHVLHVCCMCCMCTVLIHTMHKGFTTVASRIRLQSWRISSARSCRGVVMEDN